MLFLCPSIPQSFLFTTLLLLSQLTAGSHAKTFKRTIPVNGFGRHCAFELGGNAYNLCPLTGARISAPDISMAIMSEDHRGEGPSSGKRVFSLNIGRANIGRGNGRDQEQSLVNHKTFGCDDETWICLTEILDGKDVESIPLAQAGSEITAILDVEENGVPSAVRLSTLSSDFVLSCSEVENLRHFSEERGVYSFVWDTPHGCQNDFNVLADQTEDEVPQEEKGGNDDLMPQRGMSTIRKLMIAAFFTLVIPLVYGTILLSSPRTRTFTTNKVNGVVSMLVPFISVATVKLRPFGNKINTLNSKLKSPFRQGGNKLVVWAQEDMSLADSEDVMVNGSGALNEDGWNADGLQEYIPLSLNPKHGRGGLVRSYGATPTVETFAERQEGWLGGIGRYFRR